MPRYAIFFVPLAEDPLNSAAAEWLGRDVFTGASVVRPSLVDGIDLEQFDALTASARRYGFHGTLKAPFALAEGKSIEELETALEAYCKTLKPFTLPRFEVGQLGAFFALRPSEPSEQLKSLASNLVQDFDAFRAPLEEKDIARRNPDNLTKSQRDNLFSWGYPYIFDDFRFHMTLTNPVPDALAPAFHSALVAHFASHIEEPREVLSLALYEEPEQGGFFTVRRQIRIG
nr:DUF1045 domain-containing protein [uncultured Cohaesibacter sp.]